MGAFDGALLHAIHHHGLGKHGRRAHPQALFAVQGAVQRHRLQRFAVAHGVEHPVQIALVVAVQAGWGSQQRRKVVNTHGTIVSYAPQSPFRRLFRVGSAHP